MAFFHLRPLITSAEPSARVFENALFGNHIWDNRQAASLTTANGWDRRPCRTQVRPPVMFLPAYLGWARCKGASSPAMLVIAMQTWKETSMPKDNRETIPQSTCQMYQSFRGKHQILKQAKPAGKGGQKANTQKVSECVPSPAGLHATTQHKGVTTWQSHKSPSQ